MPQRSLLTQRTTEVWLTAARAVLALVVAVAIVLTPQLYLEGLVGTLGMYAATDGVIAALSRRHPRHATWEGVLSVLFGVAIMLWADTQRALLLLFCARTALVAGVELFIARQPGERAWLSPRAPAALLAYAALAAIALSLALALTAPAGYGALDLYACIAGTLAIWASLIGAHAVRLHRAGPDGWTPPTTPRGRRRVSWT